MFLTSNSHKPLSTNCLVVMENNEVVKDVYPFFRVYKDGRVERFNDVHGTFYLPPSQTTNGVSSKDITISPVVSARLYLPNNTCTPGQKLPVLVYYHGGGLVIESPFSNWTHRYVNLLASQLNAIVISVNYRLAPENDVPTIYDDCWTALQWVTSHANKDDSITSTFTNYDPWLKTYGDFDKFFLVGDSAGGNIVFTMTMRAGTQSLNCDVGICGSILAFPYFLIENIDQEGIPYKIWINIRPPLEPGFSAIDSPTINPLAKNAPSLSVLGCSRLLVCIAEKDEYISGETLIRFVEGVKKSEWKGELKVIELEEVGHSFQIYKPECEKAKDMMMHYASFIHNK